MIDFAALAGLLAELVRAGEFPGEEGSVVLRPAERPVRRLALALDPPAGAPPDADALFLHRSWDWQPPPGLGVLRAHLPFDESFTAGWNLRLAAVLGLRELEVLGRRNGRPLGMLGTGPPDAAARLRALHGGAEHEHPGGRTGRIAVVGALRPALVEEAAGRGTGLYVTGAWRPGALPALRETGLGCLALGHARTEARGLRDLAAALEERAPGLRTRVLA